MFKRKNEPVQPQIPQQTPLQTPENNEKRVMVVKQIPVQEIRLAKADDGATVELLTVEEALTEILEAVRKE